MARTGPATSMTSRTMKKRVLHDAWAMVCRQMQGLEDNALAITTVLQEVDEVSAAWTHRLA
ncbi:hypothetical protein CRI93_03790 [Longimonas halophila]|uniref:Uncharacterized protein n=1 Tax=Longimonas halophila TaxID=1469170 RepID=A0A2H3P8B7_9BACT|nr:hypothetical protein CRI93_03790 [Longimonas halophila]